MAVRSGDHLRRQDEGFLRSNLFPATLRFNREVDIFAQQTLRQKFLAATHPRPRGLIKVQSPALCRFTMKIGDATCIHASAQSIADTCVKMV
jgi:hypothetical protein